MTEDTTMDMDSALYSLGVREDTLSDDERTKLDESGFVALPKLIPPELLRAFRSRLEELFEEEGESAGIEVHQEEGSLRLSDLINKGAIFDYCYTHPRVLAAVRHILSSDFKVHSLNCRFSLPGQGQQALQGQVQGKGQGQMQGQYYYPQAQQGQYPPPYYYSR